MSRYGKFNPTDTMHYGMKKIEIEDKIRQLVYGKDIGANLHMIGVSLGILDGKSNTLKKKL